MYDELIHWAKTVHTQRDPRFIDRWLRKQENQIEAVDQIAIFLAKSYASGSVAFDTASTLFNRIMAAIGFDNAPNTFWFFYVAFENYEYLDNPDKVAKPHIQSKLAQMDEI